MSLKNEWDVVKESMAGGEVPEQLIDWGQPFYFVGATAALYLLDTGQATIEELRKEIKGFTR